MSTEQPRYLILGRTYTQKGAEWVPDFRKYAKAVKSEHPVMSGTTGASGAFRHRIQQAREEFQGDRIPRSITLLIDGIERLGYFIDDSGDEYIGKTTAVDEEKSDYLIQESIAYEDHLLTSLLSSLER